MSRAPVVAGKFYPGDAAALNEEIRTHVPVPGAKVQALGVIAPHAGYMYSGDVAGTVYAGIEISDTVILLGPNHTGRGEQAALMSKGSWRTPLGEVAIDEGLAEAIAKGSALIADDESAHRYEHSLETQIPFIQYFRRDFKIVPVCLMRLSCAECEDVAESIAAAVTPLKRPVLVVASSDMTHYESHASASAKDQRIIEVILRRDARGLYEMVRKQGDSMCGVIPATIMLMACNRLGARECELAKYMTSGEISGDLDYVVGYAGVIVK